MGTLLIGVAMAAAAGATLKVAPVVLGAVTIFGNIISRFLSAISKKNIFISSSRDMHSGSVHTHCIFGNVPPGSDGSLIVHVCLGKTISAFTMVLAETNIFPS